MSLSLFRQCGFKWFLMKNVLHQRSTIFEFLNKQKGLFFFFFFKGSDFKRDGLRYVLYSLGFYKGSEQFSRYKPVSRVDIFNRTFKYVWL